MGRNYAIVAGLIETAARAGEVLGLRLDDFQPEQKQIVIRKTKGDEPRIAPISDESIECVNGYLRVRPKVDSEMLFVSEYGEELEAGRFSKQFRGYVAYADLSGFTLRGLRHYPITQVAKTDVWAASAIAGHKILVATRQSLHGAPAHVRSAHDAAAPLGRLLVNARSAAGPKRRKAV